MHGSTTFESINRVLNAAYRVEGLHKKIREDYLTIASWLFKSARSLSALEEARLFFGAFDVSFESWTSQLDDDPILEDAVDRAVSYDEREFFRDRKGGISTEQNLEEAKDEFVDWASDIVKRVLASNDMEWSSVGSGYDWQSIMADNQSRDEAEWKEMTGPIPEALRDRANSDEQIHQLFT